MSELFRNFSPPPQTTDDRLNVKQRHIKCDSPRQETSQVLYSGMTSCGYAYPGGGAVRNSSVPAITGSWTIPCDILNLSSLSIPLPNNVTLPLWPLPFQLLLFSGKKPITIIYHKQTIILFLSSIPLESSSAERWQTKTTTIRPTSNSNTSSSQGSRSTGRL